MQSDAMDLCPFDDAQSAFNERNKASWGMTDTQLYVGRREDVGVYRLGIMKYC